VAAVSPFGAQRLDEISSWEQFRLLSIRIDRLEGSAHRPAKVP
jgi:hypothetical protein